MFVNFYNQNVIMTVNFASVNSLTGWFIAYAAVMPQLRWVCEENFWVAQEIFRIFTLSTIIVEMFLIFVWKQEFIVQWNAFLSSLDESFSLHCLTLPAWCQVWTTKKIFHWSEMIFSWTLALTFHETASSFAGCSGLYRGKLFATFKLYFSDFREFQS